MQEMIFKATIENISAATNFVNSQLENFCCSMKTMNQIDIALDELFGNIAQYAYPDGEGTVSVTVEFTTESPIRVVITLRDQGIPFNPLSNEDPDITSSAEERSIGGLGVFLCKKMMDDLIYEHTNGQNVLRIFKALN